MIRKITGIFFITLCAVTLWANNPYFASEDGTKVNLWPIYYQQGSYRSLLYPFFSASKDHKAILPLYYNHKPAQSHYLLTTGHEDLPNFIKVSPKHSYVFPLFTMEETCSGSDYAIGALDSKPTKFSLAYWHPKNHYYRFLNVSKHANLDTF